MAPKIKQPTLFIIRSFWNDSPPEEFTDPLSKDTLKLLQFEMEGYAWKLQSPDPIDPSKYMPELSPHQEGPHGYTVICVLPPDKPDLLNEITAKNGITGRPEIDRLSDPKPLSEVTGNPIIIERFPADKLYGHLIVVSNEGQVIYQGIETA